MKRDLQYKPVIENPTLYQAKQTNHILVHHLHLPLNFVSIHFSL